MLGWARRVLAVEDPGYLNLRKAARAAVVTPALLAFGIFVLDNDAVATYAFFGGFVALVFADYGGPPRQRAQAYLTMTLLGAGAIAVGGLLADHPIPAAIVMFAIVFAAKFSTVFGGYRPLHVAPVALAFSLSVLQSTSALGIDERLLGWTLGGLVALVGALVLWPTSGRTGIVRTAARLADELAAVIEVRDHPGRAAQEVAIARSTASELKARLSTPLRPSGPTVRDFSIVHLGLHLQDAMEVVDDLVDSGGLDGSDPILLAEVSASLRRTASVLRGERRQRAGRWSTVELDTARLDSRARMEATARHRQDQGHAVLDTVEGWIPLQELSHFALWIEFNARRVIDPSAAEVVEFASAPELEVQPTGSIGERLRRSVDFAATELHPNSVIVKNSLRSAAALAVAVAVAEVAPVGHGFWIVLAALAVIRSSASSTYATALQAIVGTGVGFVLAAGIVAVTGDSPTLLWILFPLTVALAGYSPGAVHFGVGQAAFTVLVVVLFSLLDLPGIDTDVARIETVTVGVVTAVVLGLLMWPRGARSTIAAAVADMYATAAIASETAASGSDAQRRAVDAELVAAYRRADAAFSDALAEHSEPVTTRSWIQVMRPPRVTRDLLVGLVPRVDGVAEGCQEAAGAAAHTARSTGERLQAVSDTLVGGDSIPTLTTTTNLERSRQELESCLQAANCRRDAVALVGGTVIADQVCRAIDEARPALASLAESARPRSWLR